MLLGATRIRCHIDGLGSWSLSFEANHASDCGCAGGVRWMSASFYGGRGGKGDGKSESKDGDALAGFHDTTPHVRILVAQNVFRRRSRRISVGMTQRG